MSQMFALIPPKINRIGWISLTVLFLLADSVSAGASGKNVVRKVLYKNNMVTVYVKPAQSGVRPKYKYNVISGNRFYIDFLDSIIEDKLDFAAKIGNVTRISRNQFNRTTSRVVLQLKSGSIKPTVTYASNPPPTSA